MYCSNCGNQISDDAVFCQNCGHRVKEAETTNYTMVYNKSSSSGLKTAAKIFMILSTVFMGLSIIPLAWTLPMTLSYCNKINNGEKVSIGFKICTLLFVNLIAGILMLCDNAE